MLVRLRQIFLTYAQWKFVGLGLCLFVNIVAFLLAGGKLLEVAPNAAGLIDLKFSYSPEEVYQMVESYGGKEEKSMWPAPSESIYPILL